MVKIRLTRMGKKHQPTYRVVVIPKEHPVAGDYLDNLGTYNPIKSEVKIDTVKALEWLNKGAKPSERVARLLAAAGVEHKSVVVKVYTPKAKEEAPKQEEAPVAEPAATEEVVAEETAVETAPEEVVAPAETEETPAETEASQTPEDTTEATV